MERPLAQTSLHSNCGNWTSTWTFFDFNEDVLAVDLVFKGQSLGIDLEIWTSLPDQVVSQLPHVYCSRLAVINMLRSMFKWCTMPISELATFRYSEKFDLSALAYQTGEFTNVSIGEPAIQRSSPDHRFFDFSWKQSRSEVRHGFTIDVSSTLIFLEPLKPLFEIEHA